MDYHSRHHGLFIGYAPRDNPQIAVAIVAEHECHGSNAAHLAQEIVDAYMTKQALLTGSPLTEDQSKPVSAVQAGVGPASPLQIEKIHEAQRTTKIKPARRRGGAAGGGGGSAASA